MTDLYDHTDTSVHPDGDDPVHFPLVPGERLEHLATERRGPLRWGASLVLGTRARVERGRTAGDVEVPAPAGPPAAVPPVATAVTPSVAAGGAYPLSWAVGFQAKVKAEPGDDGRPPPMPGSGWSWSPDDEQTWGAWEATDTPGGADDRLATLAVELECPLPVAVRWAQRLKSSGRVAGTARPQHPDGDTDQG